MATDLKGKVAVVTGAAMGLGKAVALRLAQEGSDIVLVDIDAQAMQETAREVQALGRNTRIHAVDISDWAKVKQMADEVIADLGRVDIVVNSAGVLGPTKPVWEYTVEEWDLVVAIDLKGTFLMCKAFIEQMRKQQSGRIVNIASIAGKDGNPNLCAYTAAKAGVIGFTKGLAKEVAGDGILVNSIAPTMIEGRMSASMTKEQKDMLFAKIPMGRLGKAEEVAALVNFLVSDDCSYSTGACYDISGGRATY